MRIAVIGSNMVDLTSYITRMPILGETLEAPDFTLGCGGKGANQAVAAAVCGTDVLMMTKVGSDIFADNTISNFRIIKGANNHLMPADIDAGEKDLRECSLIVLQLEIPLATVYHAIAFGQKHHIPVLLNPAPATKDLDIEKVCACDFFVPNETELAILTGMPTETRKDVEQAAASLIERGLKNVIVTLGGRGALWMTADEKQYIEAYQVNAVDTSGAGDAFIGCFCSSYVQDRDVSAAMQRASAFAALSVTRKGTQMSYPRREELEDFLKPRVS